MSTDKFFDSRTEESKVKAEIAFRYFNAWATVMLGTQDRLKGRYGDTIAYVDLFAGPGRYQDGSTSTPLLILQQTIDKAKLRDRLVTVFNDRDAEIARKLESEIQSLPNVRLLKFKPSVTHYEVGPQTASILAARDQVPTFYFVDPFGYKIVTLDLIQSLIAGWGCECLVFFNYARINAAIENPQVYNRVDAIFGVDAAETLRQLLQGKTPSEREQTIIETFCSSVKQRGGTFVSQFSFTSKTGSRTSHYLIHVTKHPKGHDIAKSVMASSSSATSQGVANFKYNRAVVQQPRLDFDTPLETLELSLLETFGNRTLTVAEITQGHGANTLYLEKNYKEALRKLELSGQIQCNPPREIRPKNTMANHVLVSFPPKGA